MISEMMAFSWIVPLILVVLSVRRPLDLLWSLPLLFVPFAAYALLMLSRAPDAFSYDLQYTFGRLGAAHPFEEQLTILANNYGTLLRETLWMPLGIAGLFLLRPPRVALVCLLFFWLPLATFGRIVALYSLSAYYMIPFLPFVALGVAALVDTALRNVWRALSDMLRLWRIPASARQGLALAFALLALLLLVGVPLLPAVNTTLLEVHSGYRTPIDDYLANPRDVRAVADYMNTRAEPEDIVIASPTLGWLLRTNVADFQMTAAAAGRDTPHLPGDLPADRWAFPMAFTAARYVVTDPLWYSWGVIFVPGLTDMLADIETWPIVFQSGDLKVHANPGL
jgi:hypothetical protein